MSTLGVELVAATLAMEEAEFCSDMLIELGFGKEVASWKKANTEPNSILFFMVPKVTIVVPRVGGSGGALSVVRCPYVKNRCDSLSFCKSLVVHIVFSGGGGAQSSFVCSE